MYHLWRPNWLDPAEWFYLLWKFRGFGTTAKRFVRYALLSRPNPQFSLSPLFKAILQRETTLDLVLQTVGLRVDSAGLELPGAEISEGNTLENPVWSALKSLGIQNFQHSSKSMRLHPDLVRWAVLILVPALMEEEVIFFNAE